MGGRARSFAFTLIELLVVIAVIAILAALTMPVVLRAMRTAASAQCKSNLRQIHAAMMTYANQYPVFIVPARSAPHTSCAQPENIYWYDILEPFVKDRGVFRCPAKNAPLGYAPNINVTGIRGSGSNLWGSYQSLTVIRNPSGSVIFCDTGFVINGDDDPGKWEETRHNPHYGYCRAHYHGNGLWDPDPWRPVPRHPGAKTNCLFFDGHVDGIVTADLVGPWYGDPGCLMDNQ